MNFLRKSFASHNLVLIFGDIIIAFASVYASIFLRFFSLQSVSAQKYFPLLYKAVIFSIIVGFMCFFMELYNIEKRAGRKEIILKILLSGLLTAAVLAVLYYFIPSTQMGRGILFLALCITVLLQIILHMSYELLVKLPVGAKKVLILGTGPVAKTMGNILYGNNNGFALSGYINCIGEPVTVPSESVIGDGNSVLAVALREKVQKIIVSLTERRGTFPVREMLSCKLRGIDVVDGPFFYEQMTGKLLIENLNPSHVIFSEGFRITAFRSFLKRIFDVLFAGIGVIFSLPFLPVIPVLIKLDSKGPVLFKQRRVGEGEKSFTLYKFRTMIDGAENETGPVWSRKGDYRITKLGAFLRKSRLDEIPQLFNVIRGDMSFIGPRPERPFFVESLKKQIPYYSERHCIKPGITGWAQVRYEYGDSIEDVIEKMKYDLYYIKYQSILIDLLIVLDTVKVILFGRGAR